MKEMIEGIAFHCHHNRLVEYVHDYDGRLDFIHVTKWRGELELRLRLFKMIPDDRLPTVVAEARTALFKARVDYYNAESSIRKAEVALNEAWATFDKVMEEWDITELHNELCPDCTWDGSTIFSEEKK